MLGTSSTHLWVPCQLGCMLSLNLGDIQNTKTFWNSCTFFKYSTFHSRCKADIIICNTISSATTENKCITKVIVKVVHQLTLWTVTMVPSLKVRLFHKDIRINFIVPLSSVSRPEQHQHVPCHRGKHLQCVEQSHTPITTVCENRPLGYQEWDSN